MPQPRLHTSLPSDDLVRRLIELGTPRLVELVGLERVEAIHDVLQCGVNERQLVALLQNRHGTQLLADRAVRWPILGRLPQPVVGWLLDGELEDSRELSQAEWRRVEGFRWHAESDTTLRVLALFGLDASWLPATRERPPGHFQVSPPVQLFEHQLRVKDRIVRSLSSDCSKVLVHMPTGAGKTRTTAEAAADYVRAVASRDTVCVWLAHSEELCEQAVSTLATIWEARGDESVDFYRLWGSHPTPELGPRGCWIVASLQRIHAMRTSRHNAEFAALATLRQRCSLLVMDEAHKSLAPTYAEAINFIADPTLAKIIGLTATPGRGPDEDENRRLARFYDNNRISITGADNVELSDPIGYLQKQGFLARIHRKVIETDTSVELSPGELQHLHRFLDVPPAVLRRLASDARRNAILLAEICRLCEDGHHAIVFACSVDHAHLITEMLLLRGVDSRCIDGGTPDAERTSAIAEYRHGSVQVLVNYGVLTTGFDAPNTNAIVIARPTGSLVLYSQMLGRGIRGPKVGGNAECLVLDLKDNIQGFPDERQAFTHFNDHWNDHG